MIRFANEPDQLHTVQGKGVVLELSILSIGGLHEGRIQGG